jgi:hypothetical protein
MVRAATPQAKRKASRFSSILFARNGPARTMAQEYGFGPAPP